MKDEEKKAIEKLKQTTQQCHNSKECWENKSCPDCYVEVEDILAIDTILNLIDKQNKVIDEILNDYVTIDEIRTITGLPHSITTVEELKKVYFRKVEEDDNRTSQ